MHFDLWPRLRTRVEVKRLRRTDDGWSMEYVADVQTRFENFDKVSLCTGIFQRPVIMLIKSLGSFTGTVTHSSAFKR